MLAYQAYQAKTYPSQLDFWVPGVPGTMRWNLFFEVKGANLVGVVKGTQQT